MTDLETLRAIPDPADRVHAINAATVETSTRLAELGQLKVAAIREMRAAGMSHGAIATTLGISRSRAQQLAEGR